MSARPVRRGAAAALLCVVAASSACIPTLSQPRGAAHLEAMARGRRHHHPGRMLAAARAFGEAARAAERRVDRDEALYREAKALDRAGRWARALAILDRVARERPPSRRTLRARFDASLLRLDHGQRRRGLSDLRLFVREHPGAGNAARALRLLLDDFESRGEVAAALGFVRALYRRVARSDLGDNLLYAEASLSLQAGDREGARAAYQRIVREHPYPRGELWDDALWHLADMAEQDGDPRAALRALQRLVAVREWTNAPGSYILPRLPAAQLRIARLYRDRLHDVAAACRAFEATYDDYPHSTLRDDALAEWGELRIASGARDAGCALLRQVTREFEVGRARRRAARRLSQDCR